MIPPESQCSNFDFTYAVEFCKDHNLLMQKLNTFCDKFVFQKELSDKGYEHYQGRFHLGIKRNGNSLKNLLVSIELNELHFTVTVTKNTGTDWYMTKPETRLAGPWRDGDLPLYVPRQIRDIELRPWQQHIVSDAELFDTRTINFIYCPKGNVGKSTLATYIGVNKLGRALPSIDSYKDVMQAVMSGGDCMKCKLYLVDMPRAINQAKMSGLFAAIEEVKSGHAFDTRHSLREVYFDNPNIWVFSNILPNMAYLSIDRWKLWTINDDHELVEYTNQ